MVFEKGGEVLTKAPSFIQGVSAPSVRSAGLPDENHHEGPLKRTSWQSLTSLRSF